MRIHSEEDFYILEKETFISFLFWTAGDRKLSVFIENAERFYTLEEAEDVAHRLPECKICKVTTTIAISTDD